MRRVSKFFVVASVLLSQCATSVGSLAADSSVDSTDTSTSSSSNGKKSSKRSKSQVDYTYSVVQRGQGSASIADARPKIAQSANYSANQVNSEEIPRQILRTGVNLTSRDLSPNGKQLADQMELTPLLVRIQQLRKKVNPANFEPTTENLASSNMLMLAMVEAQGKLQEADLSVDFAIAEITAEQQVYDEILNSYTSDRDKSVLKTNAISFMTNGVLWAACEGLDIPTYARPRYSVSSGTLGILAGIVPSIASAYALYQLNGKKSTSESDPNMLSKVFNYPTTKDIDYPAAVWSFLNSVPAANDGGSNKTRKEQLVDRWKADKNIPSFTDKSSKADFDVITASVSHKKGLTISSINTRLTLLSQLSSEVLKMKRLLLELNMVVRGEKDLIADAS